MNRGVTVAILAACLTVALAACGFLGIGLLVMAGKRNEALRSSLELAGHLAAMTEERAGEHAAAQTIIAELRRVQAENDECRAAMAELQKLAEQAAADHR